MVRVVQQARRDAGLSVSDRIRLVIGTDGALADAVRAHGGFVAASLAVNLDVARQARWTAIPSLPATAWSRSRSRRSPGSDPNQKLLRADYARARRVEPAARPGR